MTGSGGDADVVSVSGGSAGIEAEYDAIRDLAATYDAVGDRMRALARTAGRVAVDPDLLESAVLSPGTAVRAEAAVVAATAGPDGVLVGSAGCELDALAIRGAVEVLECTDAARHDAFEVIDYSLGRAVGFGLHAPAGVVGVAGVVALGGQDAVTEHPAAVQHLVNGGGGLVSGVTYGVLPTYTTADGAEVVGALYPDGHAEVTSLPDVEICGEAPTSVEDLVAHLGSLAGLSQGADSPLNGTIEIQTITGADGQVVHIVNLPGTDDLGTLPWTPTATSATWARTSTWSPACPTTTRTASCRRWSRPASAPTTRCSSSVTRRAAWRRSRSSLPRPGTTSPTW